MKEHNNAAILKAYADNTDLVIFMLGSSSKWSRTNPKALMDYPDDDFFACLPKHEKPCLHWLNGGDAEVNVVSEWRGIRHYTMWDDVSSFMDSRFCIRIKPRKEKRWIIFSPSHGDVNKILFQEKPDMRNYGEHCQLVEIEVEI
ncbi:hypothetical protein [Vibrio phage vB_VaS_L1]|nr:hypothetical protein [Vibrio phage vB_VaS_L1]